MGGPHLQQAGWCLRRTGHLRIAGDRELGPGARDRVWTETLGLERLGGGVNFLWPCFPHFLPVIARDRPTRFSNIASRSRRGLANCPSD